MKDSRGGDGARLRNALPLQLPLPLHSFAAPVTRHRVTFHEFWKFERRETVERYNTLASFSVHDLSLELCGDSLVVKHIRDQRNAAIADRLYPDESGDWVFEIDAFCVKPGEWGQLRYNGRYVHIHGWWYEQSVYNIGVFPDAAPERFVATSPDHRFVDMATLH